MREADGISVDTAGTPVSVVIPAHNEERIISRTLDALVGDGAAESLEIVVVCNGCTDGTATVARQYAPSVTVLETEIASKAAALRLGDENCSHFPRVYLDADVSTSAFSIAEIVRALGRPAVLAAAPRRRLNLTGASWLVRSYYDVWQQLPQVKAGLFGRGVIAVSEVGHARIRTLPRMMSDDLVMSEAFASDERVVVPTADVEIWTPRTARDLMRRRIRVVTGNVQASRAHLRTETATTSVRTLMEMASSDPRLAIRIPVFVAVSVLARILARRAVRRGDFGSWLRDESSRTTSA